MSLAGNDTESDTESGGQKMFRHSGWKGRTGSMNKRGRKFLSVSLAAMMTLNMLPAGTIYAEETVTEASSESKETQVESKKPGTEATKPETEATKPETEATKAETASTEAATQPEMPKAEETKTPETAGETATTEETTATESASETTDSEQTETTAPDSETAASKAEKETAGEQAGEKAEQPKIVKAELEEKDGKTYVRVYTDSKMYDRLYVGKKDDADKAPVIEGRKRGEWLLQLRISGR